MASIRSTPKERESSKNVTPKPPSVIAGAMIIAGTAVGAGMFSMPVVSSGMWFSWSVVCILCTWFCMYHTSLLILETNLNYPVGSSFNTFVLDMLGMRWNVIHGLAIAFVMYILTYAFISGGGSMITHSLQAGLGLEVPDKATALVFSMTVAFVVWISTRLVSRVATVLLGGMIITFILSIGDLTTSVRLSVLLDSDTLNTAYFPFVFAALPYFVASFGYHGNVPSMIILYGKDPKRIQKCLLYGSLLSMFIYLLWQFSAFGNIPRAEFRQIVADGGNIGILVAAFERVIDSPTLGILLNTFAILAVVSSFIGLTLGLFDYVADLFNFDDDAKGRFKSAMITFGPPTIAALIFPGGFIYAIGFAGLVGTIVIIFVPALAVRQSRKRFGNPLFRVWGGSGLILFILLYGIGVVSCFMLAMLGVLPVYG